MAGARLQSLMATAYEKLSSQHGAMTLGLLFDRLGKRYRRRPAFTLDTPIPTPMGLRCKLTFEEVQLCVVHYATVLHHAGVRPGQRVAIALPNRLDYALHLLALTRVGAVAVPLHHHLTPRERDLLLTQSRARFVLCESPNKSAWGDIEVLDTGVHAPFGQALRMPSAHPIQPPHPSAPNDVAAVLFTSGTTGTPKGAQLTSRSLLSSLHLLTNIPNFGFKRGAAALPLAHVMGLATLLAGAIAGVHMYWSQRFEPRAVYDTLRAGDIDFFVGVPAMFARLAEVIDPNNSGLSHVRAWVSGADVMPQHLIETFCAYGAFSRTPLTGKRLLSAAFCEVYGMVELSGAALCAVTPPRPAQWFKHLPWPRKTAQKDNAPGSWAITMPPFKARVVNPQGHTQPAGEVGELVLQGPGMSRGYANNDHATATLIRDGWLHTGDLAVQNHLGWIKLVGRQKDVIKHGGFSVFPAEVEELLREHPHIKDAVVFGIPHPHKGEIPVAALVSSGPLDLDAILSWCRAHMAPYRAPRAAVQVSAEAIPRNPNGKVKKDRLREQVATQLYFRNAASEEQSAQA